MYPDEEEMCKPHTVKLNSGNTNFFSFNNGKSDRGSKGFA